MAGYDFTNRVRGALIKAREEAHRRNHEYVGTEHLLLGLLDEDDALVMDVLENLGASPARVRHTVEGMIQNIHNDYFTDKEQRRELDLVQKLNGIQSQNLQKDPQLEAREESLLQDLVPSAPIGKPPR